MGCENSKSVRVQPGGPISDSTSVLGKEEGTHTPVTKHKQHKDGTNKDNAEYQLDGHGNKVKSRRRSQSPRRKDNSCTDPVNNTSLAADRTFSATSKQSTDSGLGEDESRVKVSDSEVHEKLFKPRDEQQASNKEREAQKIGNPAGDSKGQAQDRNKRVQESQIMQRLQDEGLISRPHIQASGGMRFDIIAPLASGGEGGLGRMEGLPRPPPRLDKLALERRQKKKKRVLTEEDIREKLEVAERRRKRREEERLAKLRERERTDAVAALEDFVQYQKNKEETISQRMDQVHDNRERKLQELKEKQERRKIHAEEVRKRKALVAQNETNELSCQSEDSKSVTFKMTPRPEMTAIPERSAPGSRIVLVEGVA